LLLSLSVGPWGELPRFVHFLDVFALFLLPVVEGLFSHCHQVKELVVFNKVLEFLGCELLKRVAIKEALA
jgi:hypothetical protein